MFEKLFKPSGTLLEVFERQFEEENGTLVYRRYGKGAAYRTTDTHKDELVGTYIREYRKNYILTIILSLLAFGCVIPLILVGVRPEGASFWIPFGALFVLIVAWFTWANHRAVARPEQVFSRNAPISSALSPEEARYRKLSQISYGSLALAPLFGLLMVFTMSDKFDVWSGYGRAIWLVPIGFALLSAVQALRKYKADHRLT